MTKFINFLLFGMIFVSLTFCTEECETTATTPCEAEIGKSISTSEILDANVKSAKIESLPTADGGCHANMEVSFRWDPDSELTTEPPIIVSFNTLFGYFPAPPAKKSGDYWVIAVNEAADKSKPGETQYSIEVRINDKAWDASMPDIWVDMSLDYVIFDQSLYDEYARIN